MNSNEEAGGAKSSSHSDTENNDAEEDDTGDNGDELYKEWSDIPALKLHFVAATRTVTKTSFIESRTRQL